MTTNQLRTVIRSIWRNRLLISLNSIAIGISIACCIAAYLWVAYDLEFDDFHKDEDVEQIYKLHSKWELPEKGQNILAPFALGPNALQDIAAVEDFTRYSIEHGAILFGENVFKEGIAVADSSFYSLFDFPTVAGSVRSFKDNRYVVMSEALALKIFGDETPIEKSLFIKFGHQEPLELIVGAVIQDVPPNSSFTFGLMMRIEQYQKIKNIGEQSWNIWPAFSTFFKINAESDLAKINDQFQHYLLRSEGGLSGYQLEHFKADFTMNEILGAMVNLRMWQGPIRILVAMAIMIFMIGCFNLSNTTIASISRRMKEIDIRRSLGAAKSQIFLRFLFEIIVTMVFALIIGLIIANEIVPHFADMWAEGAGNRWQPLIFRIIDISWGGLALVLILLVLVGTLLSGLNAAIFLSKLKLRVIGSSDLKLIGTSSFNRVLLVFQFSISFLILVLGLVFTQNVDHMLHEDVGFDKDQALHLRVGTEKEAELLKNSVDQLSGVLRSTWSQDQLGAVYSTKEVRVNQLQVKAKPYFVGEGYFETMGIRLRQGRKLKRTDKNSIVVSESFVALANLDIPIGKQMELSGKYYSIVGVVEDVVDNWYLLSAQNQLPLVFLLSPSTEIFSYLVIRCETDRVENVRQKLANIWKVEHSGEEFHAEISMNEGPLKTAKDLRNIFIFLTSMTLLISIIGMITLAKLNVKRRLVEIGVRKVLGATILQIIYKLNHEFVIIFGAAVGVGLILSYWLISFILQSDYRVIFTDVDWTIYLLAILLLGLLGFFASGFTVYKEANQNPTTILRAD